MHRKPKYLTPFYYLQGRLLELDSLIVECDNHYAEFRKILIGFDPLNPKTFYKFYSSTGRIIAETYGREDYDSVIDKEHRTLIFLFLREIFCAEVTGQSLSNFYIFSKENILIDDIYYCINRRKRRVCSFTEIQSIVERVCDTRFSNKARVLSLLIEEMEESGKYSDELLEKAKRYCDEKELY